LTIRTLAAASPQYPREVGRVEMLGAVGALGFSREAAGLVVTLPEKKPNEYAWALKIRNA
jgi:hypothetical protein